MMKYAWLTLIVTVLLLVGGCDVQPQTDVAIEHYANAMEQEDDEAALAELAEAIRADPNLSVAHAAIGDIHRRRGNYTAAVSSYEQACDTNPYSFCPHYNLGVTYRILADAAKAAAAAAEYLRKAVDVYLRAVTLKPDDFDTNLNLSACYFELDKYDLAEQYCLAAIKINDKNAFAYSNLGIICDAQDRPYDAVRAYKDSLELDIHQPGVLLNLGSTYFRLKRLADALHTFELAAKEDPDCSRAWEYIGACYFRQKKWLEARNAYEQAALIDPESAAAYRGLGVVYMMRFILSADDIALRGKGLEAWNRSLEFDSNQPVLLRLVKKYSPKLTGPEL